MVGGPGRDRERGRGVRAGVEERRGEVGGRV
jgi:hypothetical protein